MDARGWTEIKLAQQSGVSRPVISEHLSGKREILAKHLKLYMPVLDHVERRMFLAAWLRDNQAPEVVLDLLNLDGDDLNREVKEWIPALGDENKRRLAYWAREVARDPELEELFRDLSARAGYHPRRTATGPAKRKRRAAAGGWRY